MVDRALLIGINDYQVIGDLNGCVNDVRNVRDLLMRSFGFKAENISLLVDESATKDRIKRRLKWLFGGAGEGDQLVFHFSGHGSFIRDVDGDESDLNTRPNLRNFADELICLYGMNWRRPETFIIDDEFKVLFEGLPKGARLTVILDCCHSGTGTRDLMAPPPDLAPMAPRRAPQQSLVTVNVFGSGPTSALRGGWGPVGGSRGGWGQVGGHGGGYGGGYGQVRGSDPTWGGVDGASSQSRYLPPPADILAREDEWNPVKRIRFARSNGKPINHILLAGCREDQTSADAYIGGAYNGAFSYFLCKAVRETAGPITLGNLIRQVRQALVSEGFIQVPQLEGAEEGNTFLGA